MPTVRVFLPTYRRTRLLERAIASLRAQTFPNWICELHNDAPDDDAPARLLAQLGDERFVYRRHEWNLGGTATFNLIFRATPEPFYAMLEDDNAWAPEFLTAMLATAAEYPDVTIFWANQRVWQEQPDGSLKDTGRLVHPYEPGDPPRLIAWGHSAQTHGAVHSHGGMLVRSRAGEDFSTPAVPIALVEAFRERMFAYPLVFVPRPLVDFSQTRNTARSTDRAEWAELQTMLAATYLKHAGHDATQSAALWADARNHQPPTTSVLLFAGLVEPSLRSLFRFARIGDWLRWLIAALRRPQVPWRILRSRRRHAAWWEFLERHTARRFEALRRA